MKRITVVLTILALAVLVMPAAAQDSTPSATPVVQSNATVNYCAGKLAYDLPEGWVDGDTTVTQYGAALRIANNERALTSQTPQSGDAMILVNVIGREFLTGALRLDADTNIVTLLQNVGAQAPMTNFTPDLVTSITVADQPAAQLVIHNAAIDMTMIAVDLDPNIVGLVVLSTPAGAGTTQQATALDFASSLAFDVPEAAGSFIAPTATYASDDCKVGFDYPADWTLLTIAQAPGQYYQVQVKNYDAPTLGSSSAYSLVAGQARVEIGVVMPAPTDDSNSLDALAEQISQQPGYTMVSRDEMVIGGQTALLIGIHVDNPAQGLAGESLQISMRYGDNAVIALALYTAPGELDDWRDTAIAIAESLAVDVPSAGE